MTGIILTEKKLERRRLALQQVFRAVARSSRVEVFYQYGATSIIIGLGKENFGSDLRRARHPSRISNIFVNYFEVWLAQKGGVQFLLDKAYMHLDIPFADGTGDEEVLALLAIPQLQRLTRRTPTSAGLIYTFPETKEISVEHTLHCV